MNIYEKIANTNDFTKLKLKDFKQIKFTCNVKNAVGINGNTKRYFYKIILNSETFKYDLDKKYSLIDLLQIVKNDILLDLPF